MPGRQGSALDVQPIPFAGAPTSLGLPPRLQFSLPRNLCLVGSR